MDLTEEFIQLDVEDDSGPAVIRLLNGMLIFVMAVRINKNRSLQVEKPTSEYQSNGFESSEDFFEVPCTPY